MELREGVKGIRSVIKAGDQIYLETDKSSCGSINTKVNYYAIFAQIFWPIRGTLTIFPGNLPELCQLGTLVPQPDSQN